MQAEETLAVASEYLNGYVRKHAQQIDESVDALGEALKGLCERNLMALRRPIEYGGPALSELRFRQYQEEVARNSGALAFLQTQHQSAAAMIAKSENDLLKQKYLPEMGNGGRLVGIGFSQLRRHGEPITTAKPVDGGYVIDGKVPWVTGYGLYREFIVGASLPDGAALFAVVPFSSEDAPEIKFSEIMRLAAMESAQTVSADIEQLFVPEESVVFIKPPGWIHSNDMINIVLQGFFAIGCARAGLDILDQNRGTKNLPFLAQAHATLSDEVDACREAMTTAQERSTEDVTTDEKLAARAWAIDLAVRCAHAAIASSSGAANSLRHPAQRVFRESLVYTVSAQTLPIMEATLKRLTKRT